MLRRRALFENLGGGNDWRQHLQPCEYLETDGNCWINLPFNVDNITNITNFEGKGVSGGGRFFALRKPGGRFFQLDATTSNYFFRYFCQGGEAISSSEPATNWLKFSYDSDTKICKFNDEIITNTYAVEKNINLSIILFRYFINNAYTNANNGTQLQTFETNLFKLISCYVIDEYEDNKSNLCTTGVAGMVDTLTGVFYSNDGTGSFTHGQDIEI